MFFLFFVSCVCLAGAGSNDDAAVCETTDVNPFRPLEHSARRASQLAEGCIQVVYIPKKDGVVYSATYNVSDKKVVYRHSFGWDSVDVIQSYKDFFQHISLKGWRLKKGKKHSGLEMSVSSDRYEPRQFFCKLRNFFSKCCTQLTDMENHTQTGWAPLTHEMLQGMITRYQTFKWSLESGYDFFQRVTWYDPGSKDTVFIRVPGVGVFRGVRHRAYCKFVSAGDVNPSTPLYLVIKALLSAKKFCQRGEKDQVTFVLEDNFMREILHSVADKEEGS